MIIIVRDEQTQRKLAQLRDLATDLAVNHKLGAHLVRDVAEYAGWGMVPGIRLNTPADGWGDGMIAQKVD